MNGGSRIVRGGVRLAEFFPVAFKRPPEPVGPDIILDLRDAPYYGENRHQRMRRLCWERDPYCCWCGHLYLDPDHATLEHLLPLVFGGRNTLRNCRIACGSCNQTRGGWYSKLINRMAKRLGVSQRVFLDALQMQRQRA